MSECGGLIVDTGVPVEQRLRQVLAQLELVSQVSAANVGSSHRDMSDDIGGNRPPGGIDTRDERRDTEEQVYKLKSAAHFRRRMGRARTEYALREILADAERSLEAWKRTPPNPNPEWGSFAWKRQIAHEVESGQRTVESARHHYSIGRSTVYRYVSMYGREAA